MAPEGITACAKRRATSRRILPNKSFEYVVDDAKCITTVSARDLSVLGDQFVGILLTL